MKLHTVFISYNRLELTKEAIFSWRETVHCPATFCVVDNNSDDETKRWLVNCGFDVHLLNENRFPGYATNLGWSHAPADATHLQRADNDFRFLKGWSEHAEKMFERNPRLGQLGLRTDKEDGYEPGNTGGNCIIRRDLFDAGLRYDEKSWGEYPPGYSEDSYFSPKVVEMGWEWDRAERKSIQNLASGDWSDSYYQDSYGARGIRPRRNDPTVPSGWDKGYAGGPR